MSRTVTATYQVFPTPADMAAASARLFASKIEQAVAARGVARIAISGGSTPQAMFKLLADPDGPFLNTIPWDKLQLYWVDERCVAPTEPESNYGVCKELLLDKVPLPAENVHRMEGELDPEEAASRYEAVLRNSMKLEGAESPHFDLVLLGMGPDGHTASLFPHTAGLDEMGRIAIANHVPQKDTWRITLTWIVINQAAEVAFAIAGKDKTDVLAEVLTGERNVEEYPSQLIRPTNGKLLFLLDEAAAAKLPATTEVFTTPNGSRKVGTIEI
ncbi:6-phosphogluconolactonase [Granulicella cerasi]|uniref:6-phosphogluconolactonase n=1 Tax=Granulicella cerasi TaxID=741063 RepID=A0ABW1Z962_9BACT|nr:6-phosphogluconolactonase [Granulicella cerasi]